MLSVAGGHTGAGGVGVLGHGLHREERLEEGKALHGCLLGFVRMGCLEVVLGLDVVVEVGRA